MLNNLKHVNNIGIRVLRQFKVLRRRRMGLTYGWTRLKCIQKLVSAYEC